MELICDINGVKANEKEIIIISGKIIRDALDCFYPIRGLNNALFMLDEYLNLNNIIIDNDMRMECAKTIISFFNKN